MHLLFYSEHIFSLANNFQTIILLCNILLHNIIQHMLLNVFQKVWMTEFGVNCTIKLTWQPPFIFFLDLKSTFFNSCFNIVKNKQPLKHVLENTSQVFNFSRKCILHKNFAKIWHIFKELVLMAERFELNLVSSNS